MNKNERSQKQPGLLILLAVLVAAITATILLWSGDPGQTEPTAATDPITTVPTNAETQPEPLPTLGSDAINLGCGLMLTDSGKYTGIYMEDGTNEILADVMMIIVRNVGEQDIQLAQITAVCGGEEYHFTLTDLPAGTQAMLLEQERKPAAELTSAVMDTCALFQEPVSLYEDLIRVSGVDGLLNVQNISDRDLDGDIYVYYKYAGQDLYYGGITFRIRVEGGLKAGELRQVSSGHYDPEGCAIVRVTIHE